MGHYDVELARAGTVYTYPPAADGQCVANRRGCCIDAEDKSHGILFADGYLLQGPEDFSRPSSLYRNLGVRQGHLSYRGTDYRIQDGNIYGASLWPAGRINQDGQFGLRIGQTVIEGWVHTFPGLATELGEKVFLDTMPDQGVILLRDREYLVEQGHLIDPNGHITIGTMNSRGEVSFTDGSDDDWKAQTDIAIALAESDGSTPLQLIRSNGITRYGLQHIDVAQLLHIENERRAVVWLGFQLLYGGFQSYLIISIALHLLGGPGNSENPAWRASIANKMTWAMQRRFLNRFVLAPAARVDDPWGIKATFPTLAQVPLSLIFSVHAVTVAAATEVQVYHYEGCGQPNEFCHTVRPDTSSISNTEIVTLWPHEFLHYTGAWDEYPEPGALDRPCVTGARSIMFDNSHGDVQAWHVEGIRRSAERLVGVPLQIIASPGLDAKTVMEPPTCVSHIQPNL